jgi:Membrane bound O-acyl transferase family
MFETANSLLIFITGVKKGTLTSRYLQLYNAFLVSALIHHIGSLNIPYTPAVQYQFLFFMMQPVAITIEDFAIYLGRKAGLKESCKNFFHK